MTHLSVLLEYSVYQSIARRPLQSILFPYTTLFRSLQDAPFGGPIEDEIGRPHFVRHLRPCERLTIGQRDLFATPTRSEEHTSELQSLRHLVCRLLLEKKK